MSTCATGCGRPTERMLCGRCLGVLRADLGDVGWLDEQLELVLSKQVALTEQAGGRSAETPLPLARGALKARSVLRNRLVGWVRDLRGDEPAITGPVCQRCDHGSCAAIRWFDLPADTLPMMAAWLMCREDDIAMHQAADELAGEIREAVGYAARIVDLPANRTTFAVGPCPDVSCPGEVRVFIPAERSDTEARMECGACAQVWEPSQWSRLGKRILARRGATAAKVDSEAAASLLGVTSRTVRNWVTAGRLANHGDDRRVMVELAELERVLDAA